MTVSDAWQLLYWITAGVLCALLIPVLIRALTGPRVADRVIAVNVTGSLVIILICVLAFLLKEGYLLDIALVYTLLSFLAVVLLTRISIGVYRQKRHREQHPRKEDLPDA